jgi:hypothetical protein
MANTLVFPDGVRLLDVDKDDLPAELKRAEIERMRARVQSANIHSGFVLTASKDKRFRWYAEANVDAPKIWDVFCELSMTLFDSTASLLFGVPDFMGQPPVKLNLGYGTPRQLIKLLSPHKYQLSHDCFIEYGLGKEHQGQITEVFVTTEKWFQVWFNDEVPFLSVMKTHEIPKARKLHFIDEFLKIRTTLSAEKVLFQKYDQFAGHLQNEINALPQLS